MTYLPFRHILGVLGSFMLSLLLASCDESGGGPRLPVNVIDLTDGGTGTGCLQPSFPSDQPDVSFLSPPRFLLTSAQALQSTTGQALADPGDPIEAEITVNGPTRKVKVELTDAWEPRRVLDVVDLETVGNETINPPLFSDPTSRGRYFMRLTLCGADCQDRSVVFDLVECPDQTVVTEACGVNAPYERSVFENGMLVQKDGTCIDLGGTPGVGSGTILIQ